MSNTASIIKSGYLKKLTTDRTLSALFSREWKERWIVLRADTIAYYRDRRDTKSKGSITRGFVMAIAKSGSDLYAEKCPDKKEKWGISVLTGDEGIEYHLAAKDEAEQAEWYQMLTSWHHGLLSASEDRSTCGDGSLAHAHGDQRHLSDFTKGPCLGKGGTAAVWMVRDKRGETFAMKTIPTHKLNNKAFDAVLKEAETLRKLQSLRHPFLVQFHEWFEAGGQLHLILEYCQQGNLYELQKEQTGKVFTPARTRVYMAETALAVSALHSLELTHSDLKLENLLLDQRGHIKLCDFGFTKPTHDGQGATGYTVIYASPEIINNEPTTTAVDWWALGIVLYECIAGATPFKSGGKFNLSQMLENVTNPRYQVPPFSEGTPECVYELVLRLLDRDPATRLNCVEEYLAHPFNQGLTQEALLALEVPIPDECADYPIRASFNHDCDIHGAAPGE